MQYMNEWQGKGVGRDTYSSRSQNSSNWAYYKHLCHPSPCEFEETEST